MKIEKIHSLLAENEEKIQIMKEQDNNPYVLTWYKNLNGDMCLDFSHPDGLFDLKVEEDDVPLYQVVDTLCQSLTILKEQGLLIEEESSRFSSDLERTGTANAFTVQKVDNNYILHFDEFSPLQRGFTEVVIYKDSYHNHTQYLALEHAFFKAKSREFEKEELLYKVKRKEWNYPKKHTL